MTTAGWVFMTVSIGFVVSLAVWCYTKVLTSPVDDSKNDD